VERGQQQRAQQQQRVRGGGRLLCVPRRQQRAQQSDARRDAREAAGNTPAARTDLGGELAPRSRRDRELGGERGVHLRREVDESPQPQPHSDPEREP